MLPTGIHPIALFAVLVGALAGGMLGMAEIGRRLGLRRLQNDPNGNPAGLKTIEGSMFGLLALLVGFTFSSAAGRFDARLRLDVEEVNAVRNAWQAVQLLPQNAQPALRHAFRRYLDSRIETYRLLPDEQAARDELKRSGQILREIWSGAAAHSAGYPPMMAALNRMSDAMTSRTLATLHHTSVIIYAVLFGQALICALLAGYGLADGGRRKWGHAAAFSVITGLAIYLILDMEFPRIGLIRADAADELQLELREEMGSGGS